MCALCLMICLHSRGIASTIPINLKRSNGERFAFNTFALFKKTKICRNMVIARSIFVMRTQRISCEIRSFVQRRKMIVFPAFFFQRKKIKRRKLCFVINVLNNKTIILLNFAEYRLILAHSAYGLVG